MNLLALSWKNLVHRPLPGLMSALLFALGTGLIVLLLLLNRQLEEQMERNLEGIDMVLGAKGSPVQLILSAVYHVDAPTGNIAVRDVAPFLREDHPLVGRAVPLALGDSYRGLRIAGTTPAFAELYGLELAKGRMWKAPFEAVAGAAAAKRLGLTVGSTFVSSHGYAEDTALAHDEHPIVVAGVWKPSGTVADQLLVTGVPTVWGVHGHGDGQGRDPASPAGAAELLAHPDEEITAVLVSFRVTNFQTLSLPRAIEANTPMQAAVPAFEVARLRGLMGTGTEALRVLAYVIVAVSGLSVFIALYGSLRERRYELALMRVMGASPGVLFRHIVLEGLILAGVGACAGLVLGHAGMAALAAAMRSGYGYGLTGARLLPEEVLVFTGALAIGLAASLLPAWQARRTEIGDTLAEG